VKQRSSTASTLAAIGGNPALADLTEPGHIFRNVTSRAGVEVLTREIRGMGHPTATRVDPGQRRVARTPRRSDGRVVLRWRRRLGIAGGLLSATPLPGVVLLAGLLFFLQALQAVTL
jgi:hypothetical protein